MLKVRLTNTSYVQKHEARLKIRLRAAILIALTAALHGCSTADPAESQTLTTEASAAAAVTFSPVAMIEPDTNVISELPAELAEETPEELPEALPIVIVAAADPDTSDNNSLESAAIEEANCTSDVDVIQQRMLQLINDARSEARSCGDENFSATTALNWNSTLEIAAKTQSQDMADNDFFSHTGSDGSSASERVDVAGYQWRTVGENIAAGRDTAAETVSDWLDSPGHCRNIMNPAFFEVAVSCAENTDTAYTRYWTNVLAAPR